jgi:hypothetical protein
MQSTWCNAAFEEHSHAVTQNGGQQALPWSCVYSHGVTKTFTFCTVFLLVASKVTILVVT